ncbi:cysteine desulfurase [Bombilactobacillus bombi]|uniref:cysteine desulfurase n=1 Tax=Bombilactobacillus bombi TaxID=1303590 RepID=UPI0015E5CB23|nr:cysteine desulfurase [Bombilactobacillus bombi]MBA1434540.1 cysteine desulfurase [Bombilactobacillus bombi]
MGKSIINVTEDFPILQQKINGERLAYLDNAATTQMPSSVLSKLNCFYQTSNSNVHRGVYTLAQRATDAYEHARIKVQNFIHASSSSEIIFTRGTTESLNFVACTYGEQFIHAGDEIVITVMEHHSNLIPWQQLAIRKKAQLKYIKLTSQGELDLDDAQKKITSKTKIVALCHVSNVLGVINPIKQISQWAHRQGAITVVDGAQAIPHFSVNVKDLDVDFYAFSGHKMLAPSGIGVLYGRSAILEELAPWQYGGEMINHVELYQSTWADIPAKFEAGTPNIIGAVGLGGAIDYLQAIGLSTIQHYEKSLTNYLLSQLAKMTDINIYGPVDSDKHTGVVSFNLKGVHPHDLATALDLNGVAVRAGHHCAQPLMKFLGVNAAARASIYLYNNIKDIDQFLKALQETKEFFSYEP